MNEIYIKYNDYEDISVNILPIDFYLQSTETVAEQLLAKILVFRNNQSLFVGKIVETEAYLGANDEASHSFKGKTVV